MYAVFAHQSLVYLGTCRDEALSFVDGVEAASLHSVTDLDELADLFEDLVLEDEFEDEDDLLLGAQAAVQSVGDQLSNAAHVVVQKLDDLGINAENGEVLAKKLKEGGEKTLVEVRSLGIKGMKAVGEGFVALGELLRKADAKKEAEECDKPGGCCGGH